MLCGQHECWHTFEGVHSLRVHLKRHHPEDPYPHPASTCSHISSECVEETASDAEMDTELKLNSTETALLLTLNSIYTSAYSGHATLLVSLDLSAAFDTIDHDLWCRR